MRDTMIINVASLPGHGMGIDLNIEHLIRYLKVSILLLDCYNIILDVSLLSIRLFFVQRGSIQVGTTLGIFQLPSITYNKLNPKLPNPCALIIKALLIKMSI